MLVFAIVMHRKRNNVGFPSCHIGVVLWCVVFVRQYIDTDLLLRKEIVVLTHGVFGFVIISVLMLVQAYILTIVIIDFRSSSSSSTSSLSLRLQLSTHFGETRLRLWESKAMSVERREQERKTKEQKSMITMVSIYA